jgi:hypothetical protein
MKTNENQVACGIAPCRKFALRDRMRLSLGLSVLRAGLFALQPEVCGPQLQQWPREEFPPAKRAYERGASGSITHVPACAPGSLCRLDAQALS